MGFSLNPNADPFLHTTPFAAPPAKLQYNPIPRLILAPVRLHANYVVPYLHHHPMFSGLLYGIVPPQVALSSPRDDGFWGGGGGCVSYSQPQGCQGERKMKKWVPTKLHFDVADDDDDNNNNDSVQVSPFQTQTTTLMIKNIPNQFRQYHLLNILDEHCKWKNVRYEKKKKNSLDSHYRSEYDFVYLPMDFRKYWYDGKISNLGYAFVNFTNPTAASEFCEAFDRRQWDVEVNKKVCEIKRAKLQGLKALMDALKDRIFWCHANSYLPVMLEPSSDGYRRYRAIPVGKRIGRPPPSSVKKYG